jgi:carbamoyltransferase
MSVLALSGFADAAVLVIDGRGSPVTDLSAGERAAISFPVSNGWEAASLYDARDNDLVALEKHLLPDGNFLDTIAPPRMSRFQGLGGMYSAVAGKIFNQPLEAPGKVMALASLGTASIPVERFFSIRDTHLEFHADICEMFDGLSPWPENGSLYCDLAASVQRALEVGVLDFARRLRAKSNSEKLCYAGGVALNSVANELMIGQSGFGEVFFMPAAEDSGTAIGAAFFGLWQLTGKRQGTHFLSDSLGQKYTRADVAHEIQQTPGIRPSSESSLERAADALVGGAIVGWFQGGSELGPRALGQRSILCNPCLPDMKDTLNRRIKRRESFRPFAPAILLEHVADWFDLDGAPLESPFMLRVCRVRPEKRALVPGILHVDGTARFQTVTRQANERFYELIGEFFRRTGVPMLLNTSFNVMGEPIVETPEDALADLLFADLDYCVLEDFLVARADSLASVLDLVPEVVSGGQMRASWDLSTATGLDRVDPQKAILSCTTSTRWGPCERLLSPQQARVLAVVDGCRSGWDIARALGASGDVQSEQVVAVNQALAWLFRFNVIRLNEAGAVKKASR